MRMTRRLRRRLAAISAWPLWSLSPRWLLAFVLTIIAMAVAAIGVAASLTTITAHDLAWFGLLLGCTALAIELTRKTGEQGGAIRDVQGVWELPAAILLPPLYALLVPIARLTLVQFRVRRAPVYRRVFSGAAVSLSYGAASVTFHGLCGLALPDTGGTPNRGAVWILLVLFAALVQWVLNKVIVMTAIKGSDPAASVRAEVLGREPLYNDVAEISIGVLVAYGMAGNAFIALAALPVVTLLQRSLRHVQLLTESRADSKTGLLNAATWEKEAAAEVIRAVRTKSPLAIAILDIDKFKVVNDTYGHLAGDQVLKEIANSLNSTLRDYDLAGRFGGEEFSLLLPQTRAVDAFRIAERVRANIAGLSIIAPGSTGAERVQVTVSIGVAALDVGSRRELSGLMAAADAALYRAKAGGRDQVQMISTARGLSAVSGLGLGGTSRGADGGRQGGPSAFRRAQSSLSSRSVRRGRGRAERLLPGRDLLRAGVLSRWSSWPQECERRARPRSRRGRCDTARLCPCSAPRGWGNPGRSSRSPRSARRRRCPGPARP
jgi:diguanylate cyclase (GGDEF)-like protein